MMRINNMSCLIFASLFLIILSGEVMAESLQVNVPLAEVLAVLDGRVEVAEWADGAVVRRLHESGHTSVAEPRTTFYLKHDGGCLWVAAVCDEPNPAYPKAHRRGPLGLLTDDDAVQVVLGVSDGDEVKRMDFGGNADAQGKVMPPVAHYYEFTVNAAGAVSRTYNEGALIEPLFEGRADRVEGGWTAEFRIPLKSAGIVEPVGRAVYLNLFRFRPPVRTGWYLPGWGNYVPMPFGKMALLKKEDNDKRTQETLDVVCNKNSDAKAVLKKEKKIFGEITFYPLAQRLVATIETRGYEVQGQAILRVSDLETQASKTIDLDGESQVFLDLPDAGPSNHEAALEIVDGAGTVLGVFKQEFEFYEKPEWFGTTAGIAYLNDKVPGPWTVPVIEGDAVVLAHCRIAFGAAGLPESVRDERGELLAGPGAIEVCYDGKECALSPVSLSLMSQGHSVLVQASQAFSDGQVETCTLIDYDGFMVVKFRVRGCDPAKISGLRVRAPLRKEMALFVNRGSVQDTRKLSQFGYEGSAGEIWVGCHDKGLAFSEDTSLFLSQDERSAVQVLVDNDSTMLSINLIDQAGQLCQADRIFRFMLQPTPTKKNVLGLKKMNQRHFRWFEHWSDYQAYPDLDKMPAVKAKSAEMHEQGKLHTLYFGQVLADNSPGFKEFCNDLIAPPERPWYRRAYDPGKGVPCYVCCVKGPRGDQVLDGVQRLLDEGDIDGVYMDGLSVAWDCDNPSHAGCGGDTAVEWDKVFPSRIVGTRGFLKRLRGIFDVASKPYILETHTGGGLNVHTSSLCDITLEGEQLHRYRAGYRLPLHKFAVGYSGWPWGRTDKMLAMIYDVNGSSAQAMTWTLLHDVEIEPHSHTEPIESLIYGDFQGDDTVYYPYWRQQPHVRLLQGREVVFSYYRKGDAAMLIASNLSYDDHVARFDLSEMFDGVFSVTDVVRDTPVSVVDGKVSVPVSAWLWKALRIESSESAPDELKTVRRADEAAWRSGAFQVTGFAADQWELYGRGSGVELNDPQEPFESGLAVRVTSTLYADNADYRFQEALGDSGLIKLQLKHGMAAAIMVGDCELIHANAWQVSGVDLMDIWGRIFSPPAVLDRPVVLEISFKDGRLDAVYDGKALARQVKLLPFKEKKQLVLRAWGGDNIEFDVFEISSEAKELFDLATVIKHPVR